jgi:bla regulator protein BlaR1
MTLSDAGILGQILTAALRTTALAAIAALLLYAFRVKATSARLFAWTAVLYAGLIMPILGGVLPPISVKIPFVEPSTLVKVVADDGVAAPPSAARAPQRTIVATEGLSAKGSGAASLRNLRESPKNSRSSLLDGAASISWSTVAFGAYLAIALSLFARLLTGVVFANRLLRSSTPIHDPRLTSRLSSRGSFLSRSAHVRESRFVSVPVTIGAFTPTILLPSSWREWDDSKLEAVLTHEMSHVERCDCLTQYLSLLHRAIFWFSPLAWWLNRQIVELAEQASDEAVLSAGAERNQYARTLLGFLEGVQAASGRIRWQGVSMASSGASSGQAEKRLEKIFAWRGDRNMNTKRSALVVIFALAIPAAYLVAAARPAVQEQSSPSVPSVQAQGSEPAAPAVPVTPQSPAAHEVRQHHVSGSNHRHGVWYGYGFDDAQRFVIVSGKTEGLTMSGSSEDAHHVEKLKQRIPGDFIWFQRDEKSYIIRDQATVERARQLWAPQEELGRKQEELGKQQEALGKQQQELGSRMQAVRVKVPDITAELDKLKAELQQLGPDASAQQIGRIQSEIGRLQSRMGEVESRAGDEQGKLGEEMGALGEQQGKLGEQQGELGRQQGELAEKATKEMKQLLDDAIKKGTAQPEHQESGGASL